MYPFWVGISEKFISKSFDVLTNSPNSLIIENFLRFSSYLTFPFEYDFASDTVTVSNNIICKEISEVYVIFRLSGSKVSTAQLSYYLFHFIWSCSKLFESGF